MHIAKVHFRTVARANRSPGLAAVDGQQNSALRTGRPTNRIANGADATQAGGAVGSLLTPTFTGIRFSRRAALRTNESGLQKNRGKKANDEYPDAHTIQTKKCRAISIRSAL